MMTSGAWKKHTFILVLHTTTRPDPGGEQCLGKLCYNNEEKNCMMVMNQLRRRHDCVCRSHLAHFTIIRSLMHRIIMPPFPSNGGSIPHMAIMRRERVFQNKKKGM